MQTYTREQLIKAQHKYNQQLVELPNGYEDEEFFKSYANADSQIDYFLSLVE